MRCDLCIIGAGISGLNALYVASRYLRPDQHVVLVDRKDRVGGMWVDTYDYVRLHQPHPFFTAGDVKWTLGKEPSHLASKPEVLDHFRHCVEQARQGVRVTELLGHSMEKVEETTGGVVVTCRSSDGAEVSITADRVIDAGALDVEPLQPLALSSTRVRSVSPEACDLRTGEIDEDDAPVWIIGSGKTAMDSAHVLLTRHPGREVNLLAGSGTFFLDRDRFYPTGAERWWRGTRPNAALTRMADLFDGTNEAEVFAWTREAYGLTVTPRADHFFLGLLSRAEAHRIRSGLTRVVMGHLVDAANSGDGVQLQLKAGEPVTVPAGTWIVNCTSHFVARADRPMVPYVSPGGRVVTVGVSTMFGFTSFAGYFLAHLLFRDRITEVPLYQLDANALIAKSTPAVVASAMTLSQYNLGLAFDNLPAKVFGELGLDFDRWYPLPRRLVGQLRFMVGHKRKREQYRRALDTLGERFDVHCGPVVPA